MRKIDKEVLEFNKRVYAKRSYYKNTYGLSIPLMTVKGASKKSAKELRSELGYATRIFNTSSRAIKRESTKIKPLASVVLSDQVTMKRSEYNRYNKLVKNENERRLSNAQATFDYLTERGLNPYATVEELINDKSNFQPLKINPQGHTQVTFDEFKEKRFNMWGRQDAQARIYRENLIYSVERGDLPQDLKERMTNLIEKLPDQQIIVLGEGEVLFEIIFMYKTELQSPWVEEYLQLLDYWEPRVNVKN